MFRRRSAHLIVAALAGILALFLCNTGLCTTLGFPDKEITAAIDTYNARKYRQAFSSFAALAQKKPNDTTVQYYLGLCYFQLGDKARARKQFEWIFESPADTALKAQAATALNHLLGVKEPPKTPEIQPLIPPLGIGRGTDSNGVIIGCDLGQVIPGQGKLTYTGYTVYVPKNYTGSEKLPWILALSPSGTARDWMELLQDACDKHHWAFAASQNSNNFVAWQKIVPALKDTIESAPMRFPFDPNGLCVVGFSGAATRAHQIAYLWPNVRKIIVSNGCIDETHLNAANYPRGKSVVFIAGSLDPNITKMKRDQQFLMQHGWKTKWIEFQGGHQFAPANAYDQAIEWLRIN